MYGVGDIIKITLQFTTTVFVNGAPTLTVNTGCYDWTCQTKEVITFTCGADFGHFGMRMLDQFIMNVGANTTQDQLKYYFEDFEGVNEVTVHYGNSDDRDYSQGRRVCTSIGNKVTVTFENVTLPQFNGNVPTIEFDPTNSFRDLRSGQVLGQPDSKLRGRTSGYVPKITSAVLSEGFQKGDGTAYYHSGNGTTAITFAFVVQDGDFSNDLEVKSLNFDKGCIFGNVTYANVSQSVPAFGAGPRYMSISPSSLGFNSNIKISSATPQILKVTAMNANGVYTEGDDILILIMYDLPVKVYGAENFALALSTGSYSRSAKFVQVRNETTIEMKYTVQFGDTNPTLDYLATTSFTIGKGFIFRDTSTNQTAANITLPVPGSPMSLAGTKIININVAPPLILGLHGLSSPGIYTAGDQVDIRMTYTYPVFVSGSPVVWLENSPVELRASVRTAPANPVYSFRSAQPSEMTQIMLTWTLNWNMSVGDSIQIYMPPLSTRDTSSVTARELVVSGASAAAFVGFWNNVAKIATLNVTATLTAGQPISLIIGGRTGLLAPATGILPASSGSAVSFRYSILSSTFNYTSTDNLNFGVIGPIGFQNASLTTRVSSSGAGLSITFSFSVGESLAVGDQIFLNLTGFSVGTTRLTQLEVTSIVNSYLNMTWNPSNQFITFTVYAPTTTKTASVVITNFFKLSIPPSGINAANVMVSGDMMQNGLVKSVNVPFVNQVCSLYNVAVRYLSNLASSSSAVKFIFQQGPTALKPGDAVVFMLPSPGSSLRAATLAMWQLSGPQRNLFVVTVNQIYVSFLAVQVVPALITIDITLDITAGFVVPPSGIRKGVDSFQGQIISTSCSSFAFQVIPFSNHVVVVSSPTISLKPLSGTKLGSPVSFALSFGINANLRRGETFSISLPSFPRSAGVDVCQNSLSSNIPLTSCYDFLSQSLTFTLASNVSAGFRINVAVPFRANFSLPLYSLPSNGMTLSISSTSGLMRNQVISGVKCIGICSTTATYSSSFAATPIIATFTITFSGSLWRWQRIVFLLNGFSIAPVPFSCVVRVGNTQSRIFPLYNVTQSGLTSQLLLPFAVAPMRSISFAFQGIQFSSFLVSDAVASSVMIRNTTSVGKEIKQSFPLPSVLDEGLLTQSSLVFKTPSPGQPSEIQFLGSEVLSSQAILLLSFPGFVGTTITFQPSTSTFVDTKISSWDPKANVLRVYFDTNVNITQNINVNFVGLTIPASGVTNTTVNLGYQLQIGASVSRMYPFDSVPTVVGISTPSISFKLKRINTLQTVFVNFGLNVPLNPGDLVTISILPLTLRSRSSLALTSMPGYNPVWNSTTGLIVVQFTAVQPQGTMKFAINASSVLALPLAGIPSGIFGAITIIKGGVQVANTSVSVPCVGICSASLIAAVGKAGYPSKYSLTVSFGQMTFSIGDTLFLQLPDFGNATVFPNTTGATTGVSNSNGVFMSFNPVSAILTLKPQRSPFVASSQFKFVIPLTFWLVIPSLGIRTNTFYNITLLRQDHSSISSVILSAGAVGHMLRSSIEFASRTPLNPTNISLFFELADPLSVGDQIIVYLPQFGVPSGPIPIDPVSESQVLSLWGIQQSIDVDINVDGSQVITHHVARLIVSVLQAIPARQLINFVIPSKSRILLPQSGVMNATVPTVALVSSTAPIATLPFQNYTLIGSLTPASLMLSSNEYGLMKNFTISFNVSCYLSVNDTISVIIPNLQSYSRHINVTSNNGHTFAASWTPSTSTLDLLLTGTAHPFHGIMTMAISSNGFQVSNAVVYANSTIYQFSVSSSSCPVDLMRFDRSNPSLLESSSMTFSNAVINAPSTFNLTFVPLVAIIPGDTLVVVMPNFVYLAGNSSINWGSRAPSIFNKQILVEVQSSGTHIFLTFNGTVSPRAVVNVQFPSTLVMPTTGVSMIANGIQIELQRVVRRTKKNVFVGAVQSMQAVGYFMTKSVSVMGLSMNANTSFSVSWALSGVVAKMEQVRFQLPGFRLSYAVKSLVVVPISNNAAYFFNCSWNAIESTLTFTAFNNVPAGMLMEASIGLNVGFLNPPNGLPFMNPTNGTVLSFIAKSFARQAPVLSDIITQISRVPHILNSSISFVSSDFASSYQLTGDTHSIQLYPGHELSSLDVGARVQIQNNLYTISGFDDDIMRIVEPFVGTPVVLGTPVTPIYSAPIRPATYVSGSGTPSLTFRYLVRRGDYSKNLTAEDPSLKSFSFISQSVDLTKGVILRQSKVPVIQASTVLPNFVIDNRISVDTRNPVILSLSTTTPLGTYSFGDFVDFQVHFNEVVVVGDAFIHPPILLLNIYPYGEVTATYHSGTGTKVIVFVYAIEKLDYQLHRKIDMLTTAWPIVQPMRIITSTERNYLRRKSMSPLLDANVDFPPNCAQQFPSNISMVGLAPKVITKWIGPNSRNGTFTAGDILSIYVRFSSPIVVNSAQSIPYIVLDVGVNKTAKAFMRWWDGTTMEFIYQISPHDFFPQGLFLHCTCSDYFNRTFMQTKFSQVMSGNGYYAASLILANSSLPSSRCLDSSFRIDNSQPTVFKVTSNASNTLLVPGSIQIISLHFTWQVRVLGMVRLLLRGESSNCIAHYFSGNNSNVIAFRYFVSYASGVAVLDCGSVEAIDASAGKLLRLSDNPLIHANLTVPIPGSVNSLGLTSNDTIDVSSPKIISIRYSGSSKPLLPLRSLDFSLRDMEQDKIVMRYAQELNGLNISSSNSLAQIQSALEQAVDNSINVFSLASFANITSYLVEESNQIPLLYGLDMMGSKLSSSYIDNEWWSNYQVQSTLDFMVEYNRLISSSGLYLDLATGSALNRAFAVNATSIINLIVTWDSTSSFEFQQQYRFEYGGVVTRCISLSASAQGPWSILEALIEVPALHRLGPNVRLQSEQNDIWVFEINFLRPLSYPLVVKTSGTSCTHPATAQYVRIAPMPQIMFRYSIRDSSSILLVATNDIPPGTYNFEIDSINGVSVSSTGVSPNSVKFEHLDRNQNLLSTRIVSTIGIVEVVSSGLSFGNAMSGSLTSMNITVCTRMGLEVNDIITVSLPGFTFSSVSADLSMSLVQSVSQNILQFTIWKSSPCFSETLETSLGIYTPSQASFRNTPMYKFSIRSQAGKLDQATFDSVSPIGIGSAALNLDVLRAGYNTSIDVTFELVAPVMGIHNESTIYIHLPGFTKGPFSGVHLSLDGSYAHAFSAAWTNSSDAVALAPLFNLEPDIYSIKILATQHDALCTWQQGLSPFNPPAISIDSPQWSMALTTIQDFPRVVGLLGVFLNVHLTRPFSVNTLQFGVNFSRPIIGATTLSVYIPCLETSQPYFQLPYLDGNVTWRNWNKVLVIFRNGGWGFNETATLTLSSSSAIAFSVNNLGIPHSGDNGLRVSMTGIDGSFLLPTPIPAATVIPMIKHSSVQLLSDVFGNTTDFLFNVTLNMPCMTADLFSFTIPNATLSSNRANLTVVGECLGNYNLVHGVHGLQVNLAYSNASTICSAGRSLLAWTVRNVPSPRAVLQYNSFPGAFKVSWANMFSNTGFLNVTSIPTIAFMSSAIDFQTPIGGQVSNTTVSFMTSGTLLADDGIVFQMRNFWFPFNTTKINDNWGRSWNLIFNRKHSTLTFMVPQHMQPSAFRFYLNGLLLAPTLPVRGIGGPSSAMTITLSRNRITLVPQNIAKVQPVGAIQYLYISAIAAPNEGSSSSRRLSDTISPSNAYRGVSFAVNMTLSSPLNVGDVIQILAENYDFLFDSSVAISAGSSYFTGEIVALDQSIYVTVRSPLPSNYIHFKTLPSPALSIPVSSCDQQRCPVFVSIKSQSCAVQSKKTFPQSTILLQRASIRLHLARGVPTYYPTSQPTNQPSRQPSRQPSSQPSRKPSAQPTSRPSHPSAQPSSQPSMQPSRQPFSKPSSRPSSQPTAQPSSEPSNQPTRRPTRQPTAQPSRQPSSQPSTRPSRQPSTQPTLQPTSIPTKPTGLRR